jgi:Holliday junction resolvase
MTYKTHDQMAKEENVYERQLRDWYFENGGSAVIMSNSGAGTRMDLPDVIGKYAGQEFAHEVKYTSNDYANLTKDKLEGLLRFSKNWGATPLPTVRFSKDIHWYTFEPESDGFEQCVTKDGGMQIARENRETYTTLNDLLERAKNGDEDNDEE